MPTARAKFDGRYLFKGVVDRPSNLPFDQCIELSSQLSKIPINNFEQEWEVIRMVPKDVVPILHNRKIDFMLVGAHGISGWLMQARGTQDVDILLRDKDKSKAANAILAKYPDLVLEKCSDVWRFSKANQHLLDLMSANSPLDERIIEESDFTTVAGIKIKIPRVECALAIKCEAMQEHPDWSKKYRHAGDFISIAKKNPNLDFAFLHELGELHYAGGGAELFKYVEDARAGRRLEI
ncbi:MAG TPA: hypothetical protein VKX17_13855 [Planctomycetota bacterium]|nr:hypothetical protein [Planctomycetota bacterium]